MSAIQTDGLTKHYGSRVGVEGLSLNVPEGALFGFLGPNGSGKTTTIRVLLGLMKAGAGSARIFGLDCWRDGPRIRADIGYLPGELRLYPWLRCDDVPRLFGAIRGRDLTVATASLAEAFELDPRVRVRDMSRGMRQKLGLIIALAHRPRLVMLDEPTTSLDPLMQEKLEAHLRGLTDAGHTIFFSSHTLSEVERLCDRVAIVRDGRLVADETLDALRERAGHAVTIRWQPQVNPSKISPPPFLEDLECRDREWSATLAGPVRHLLDWCAGRPIDDMSITPPDLSTLFRRYYTESEDGR